ncbi:MAG: amino acid ABC transporter permease [Leptolyngbyaceae cyanobacterium]
MTTAIPSTTRPMATPVTPVEWLQKNLFNSWYNSALTVIILAILGWAVFSLIAWSISYEVWLGWATQVTGQDISGLLAQFTQQFSEEGLGSPTAADFIETLPSVNFVSAFLVGQLFQSHASWTVIPENWPQFFAGLYPGEQYWQLFVLLGLLSGLIGLSWGYFARSVAHLFDLKVLIGLAIATCLTIFIPTPLIFRIILVAFLLLGATTAWVEKRGFNHLSLGGTGIAIAWFGLLLIGFWLIRGGLGLQTVPTDEWGGLLLTLFMAVISILFCFPLGILLALGRQSSLPIIKWLSTIYIEFVRGVPLISILFMGQIMIPLFLPEYIRPDRVSRAIVALTLFSAAYMAENVRGGLQAVARGQSEAARSLGLNTSLTLVLIVMPQALKISIPAIVGQFISLFQDTTLVAIVGLQDLLGMSDGILGNPDFLGRNQEVYLFIGVIYWVFCYAMSIGSRRIEKSLDTSH